MINSRKNSAKIDDRFIILSPLIDTHFEIDETNSNTFLKGKINENLPNNGGSSIHVHNDNITIDSQFKHDVIFTHNHDITVGQQSGISNVESRVHYDLSPIDTAVHIHGADDTSSLTVSNRTTENFNHTHTDTNDPIHIKINLIKRKLINSRISTIPLNSYMLNDQLINKTNYNHIIINDRRLLKITTSNDLNDLTSYGVLSHDSEFSGEHNHANLSHTHNNQSTRTLNNTTNYKRVTIPGGNQLDLIKHLNHNHTYSFSTLTDNISNSGQHNHINGNSIPKNHSIFLYKKNKINSRQKNNNLFLILNKKINSNIYNLDTYISISNINSLVDTGLHKGENGGSHDHLYEHSHNITSDGSIPVRAWSGSFANPGANHTHNVSSSVITILTSSTDNHSQGLTKCEPLYTAFYLYRSS